MPIAGGCSCGAVRYECTAEPILMFKCHCRDCQHVSGSAYMPVVYVQKADFKVTKGSIRRHETQSARGGTNRRGFCADCGSRLTGGESERGIGIAAGSLDDPTLFKPTMHIHVVDVEPWDTLEPDLRMFDQYPSFD